MNRRIIFDLVLLVVVLFGPWWLSFGLVLIGSVYFKDFFEALAAAFWFDLVYGTGLPDWWSYFPVTIIFIVWWFLVEWLRDMLI